MEPWHMYHTPLLFEPTRWRFYPESGGGKPQRCLYMDIQTL